MHVLRDVLTHASPEKSRNLFSFLGFPFSDIPLNPPSLPPSLDVRHSTGRHRYQQLMTVCERIKTMTDEFGYQTLVGEGRRCGIEPPYLNRYDLAIDVFCKDAEAFKRAETIRYASRYDKESFWSCFRVFHGGSGTQELSLVAFSEGVKALFSRQNDLVVNQLPFYNEAGQVELLQITISWDGIPQHFERVDQSQNCVAGGVYHPAQQYTLHYYPDKGRLEIVSGLPVGREDIANLFARTVLGIYAPLSTLVPAELGLELFLERPALYFDDEHPLEREIEWIAVSEVTLESSVSAGEIVIRPGIETLGSIDAYQFLCLHDQPLLIRSGLFRIRQVQIAIRFLSSDDGLRHQETLYIELATPNRYSMDSHGERARYIREVLFPRWGLLAEVMA